MSTRRSRPMTSTRGRPTTMPTTMRGWTRSRKTRNPRTSSSRTRKMPTPKKRRRRETTLPFQLKPKRKSPKIRRPTFRRGPSSKLRTPPRPRRSQTTWRPRASRPRVRKPLSLQKSVESNLTLKQCLLLTPTLEILIII